MSEQKISMTLSLSDLATPKLKGFLDLLGTLEKTIKTSNTALGSFNTTMSTAASGADKASKSMATLDRSLMLVGQGLSSFSATSQSINGTMEALTAVMEKVSASMIGFKSILADARQSMTGLGSAAKTAGGSLSSLVGGTATAGAGFRGMGDEIDATKRKTENLSSSWGDLIKLWGAFKVEQAIVHSTKDAVDFEAEGTKIKNLGLSKGDQTYLKNKADEAAGDLPTLSREKALTLGFDLHTAFGDVEEAGNEIKDFAKRFYNIGRSIGHEVKDNEMLNAMKFVEFRGGTQDPARKQASLDQLEGVQTAFQGRVPIASMLSNMKMLKNSMGVSASDEFIPIMASYMEQIQQAGGTGGQVGTWMTQAGNAALGRGGAANAKLMEARIENGLIDPSGVVRNTAGNIDQQRSNLQMIDPKMFADNMQKWVDTYLAAAATRAGVDMKDRAAIGAFNNTMFKGNGGEIFTKMLDPISRNLALKDAEIQNKSIKGDKAYANNTEDSKGQVDRYTKAMADFKLAIGDSILPAITGIIKGFNELLTTLGEFGKNHPAITGFATLAAALTSAYVAIVTLFPMVSKLFTFLGAGEAGASVAALAGTVMTSIGEMIAGIVAAIGGLPVLIGLAIAGIAAYFLFDGSLDNAKMFWDSLVNLFDERLGMLKQLVIDLGSAIAEAFGLDEAWAQVKLFWGNISDAWSEGIKVVFDYAVEFVDTIARFFGFESASQALAVFLKSASDLWATFWADLGAMVDQGLKYIVDSFLFPGAYDNLKSFAVSVKGAFGDMVNDIKDACSKIGDFIASTFNAAMTKLGIIRREAAGVASSGAGLGVGSGSAPEAGHPSPKFVPPAASADGKLYPGGARPTPQGKTGKGPNLDKLEANSEAEAARFEKEKLAIELKAVESLYKDHQIGIESMFTTKVETIKRQTAEEIAALEKEKSTLEKDPIKNATQIAKAGHGIIIAQMKEKQALLDVEMEKKKALESLNKEGLTIEEKLQNITKSASTAKIALLDIEYAKKRQILEINGQLAAAANLDALHNAEVNKVKYDDKMTKINLLKQVEQTAEMQAQSQRKNGYITTADAEQQIVEAKRKLGEQELVNLDAAEKYAIAIKDPQMLESIKQMKIAAEDLTNTLDAGAQKFKDAMQSGIEGGLNDLMNGTFSFKKFADSIAQSINKSVAKSLSETITNGLFGTSKDGNGGMLGGLLGDPKSGEGNFLTNLFGGTSKKGGTGASSGFLNNLFGGGSSTGGATGSDASGYQGTQNNPSAFVAGLGGATTGLQNMTKNGVEASTASLIKGVSQDTMSQSASQMATQALQQLAEAAQQASAALQSMGNKGGSGVGGLGSLFGGGGMGSNPEGYMGTMNNPSAYVGGGGGDFLSGLFSFDVGADSIPRDMIAKIHKGEMILPSDTAERIRNGGIGGGGAPINVTNNFTLDGTHDKRSQSQIGAALGAGVQKAQRRNG